MALASTTAELKTKILQQFGEEELRSRSSICVDEEALGQMLIAHHLTLGSLSATCSDDHNANLAAPFFAQLFKVSIRISLKPLQQAATKVRWSTRHSNDIAYLLHSLYKRCRLIEKNKRTWERDEEQNMHGLLRLASLLHEAKKPTPTTPQAPPPPTPQPATASTELPPPTPPELPPPSPQQPATPAPNPQQPATPAPSAHEPAAVAPATAATAVSVQALPADAPRCGRCDMERGQMEVITGSTSSWLPMQVEEGKEHEHAVVCLPDGSFLATHVPAMVLGITGRVARKRTAREMEDLMHMIFVRDVMTCRFNQRVPFLSRSPGHESSLIEH
eukprot:6491961-Amphidinium_carterae.1